ncbi:MAG: hypothetical protein WC867_02010 [Candidatus Pacearchaeota archaeon]|jgi:hypothetical protein
MKNKRGQFYLVAAVIVILAVSAITGVTTYSSSRDKPKIIDELSYNLEQEGYNIIDYGVYKNTNYPDSVDITKEQEKVATEIIGSMAVKDPSVSLSVVVGNGEGIITRIDNIREDRGSISAGDIETPARAIVIERCSKTVDNDCLITSDLGNDNIKINFLENEYTFKLDDPNNNYFYFVLSKKVGEDNYVKSGG